MTYYAVKLSPIETSDQLGFHGNSVPKNPSKETLGNLAMGIRIRTLWFYEGS